jgi:hypothetical protein
VESWRAGTRWRGGQLLLAYTHEVCNTFYPSSPLPPTVDSGQAGTGKLTPYGGTYNRCYTLCPAKLEHLLSQLSTFPPNPPKVDRWIRWTSWDWTVCTKGGELYPYGVQKTTLLVTVESYRLCTGQHGKLRQKEVFF